MKYGRERQYVEDKIGKWVNTPFDKGMAIADEMRAKKSMENASSNENHGPLEISGKTIHNLEN